MGLIAMSERDLQRIEILSKVIGGRMTTMSAAHVLDLSERQMRRLLHRIRTGGAASIRHKAIGRPSNNRISDGVRDCATTLVRERYADFGPTLATEKLAKRDGLRVSRETVRGAPDVSSAAAATRILWRAGADRRVRASLVRGSRTALLAAGVR
jgi:hypothetical protein